MTTTAPSRTDRPTLPGDDKSGGAAAQGEQDLLDIAGLAPEAALAKLKSSEKGLSAEAAKQRRARFGPNVVETARKLGVLGEIYARAKNPLVVQLLVIAAVSLLMHDVPSAVVVGVMVVL